jgi:hypothetical protein
MLSIFQFIFFKKIKIFEKIKISGLVQMKRPITETINPKQSNKDYNETAF